MKIIETGKKIDGPYRQTCYACDTVFEFSATTEAVVTQAAQTVWVQIDCPICGWRSTMKVWDKKLDDLLTTSRPSTAALRMAEAFESVARAQDEALGL